MDQTRVCTGSHTFSHLCLACFSHCYTIAETVSSPSGHMNIKWQDLQEKTEQHRKVWGDGERGGELHFRANLILKCDSVTQTLNSIRKNLVNKKGFFLFPVLIFMQSQCKPRFLFSNPVPFSFAQLGFFWGFLL